MEVASFALEKITAEGFGGQLRRIGLQFRFCPGRPPLHGKFGAANREFEPFPPKNAIKFPASLSCFVKSSVLEPEFSVKITKIAVKSL